MAEDTFQDHLANMKPDQEEDDLRGNVKPGATPTEDKVLLVSFCKECYELKKDIQNIFEKELYKACQISTSFKLC